MITTIGVVGAGQMGNGIAHVCAVAGYTVRMLDVGQDAVDRGLRTIGGNLDRQVSKGVITAEQVPAALQHLQAAVDDERAQLKAAEDEARSADRLGSTEAELASQRAITLGQRAFPLLEMLRAAQKKAVDVTWGI
jgi:3-hydroxyisobutyrate dehydrogenase-like beta-hydroxyacid dehydrogenase